MLPSSSRFFAGEIVEVRAHDEILRTLDANGRIDGLPFMPEMLRHCGRRYRVSRRAHKACDFVNRTGARAVPRAVHLDDLRCDGSAHGGCQALCAFFWHDAWLKRPTEANSEAPPAAAPVCTEARLFAATHDPAAPADDPRFVCQATQLPAFTRPLSPWDLRQYVEDYRSGNVPSLVRFLPRLAYRAYDNLINLGIGLGRPLRWCYDRTQRLLGRSGRYPATPGCIPAGAPTPAATLDLQPGEFVRVKDHAAILATIDAHGRNRGLSFSAEMAPYCGGTFRVLARVHRIVDERTGRMLRMKTPCILLEGVVCRAQFNKRMIFCPRATYSYWREIWLERVSPLPAPPPPAPGSAAAQPVPVRSS